MRAAVILCLLSSLAYADDKSDAEVLFRSGERAFNAAHYADAADAFEQAYAKLPLPAIAFSLAQAHRLQYFVDNQPQHLERAVKLYHAYIEEAQKTGGGGRVSDAVANLAQIEPLLRELQASGAIKGGQVAAKKTRLMVTADVDNAKATIDGAAAAGPTPLVAEVEPGDHTVVIEADGYAPYTVKTKAIADEMVPVEAKLVAKPAVLAVHAPPGSHVAIDGRLAPGPIDHLEVGAGKHYVVVTANGHVPAAQEVELTRGGEVKLDANMPTTKQRKVARYMLIGGGVLAAGTALFGLGWASADGDASKLEAQLATGGQDPSVVGKYNDARVRRDTLETDTLVTGGIMTAVVATGVLLYLFDTPGSEAPPITPVVGPGSAGVVYGGRF